MMPGSITPGGQGGVGLAVGGTSGVAEAVGEVVAVQVGLGLVVMVGSCGNRVGVATAVAVSVGHVVGWLRATTASVGWGAAGAVQAANNVRRSMIGIENFTAVSIANCMTTVRFYLDRIYNETVKWMVNECVVRSPQPLRTAHYEI